MSEELSTGLAATANEPVADSQTPDTVLDAAFASPEPAAGSEPSEPSTSVQEPAGAIAQPQTPADPNGAKGEPPRERWDSILENARKKAREDTLTAHKDHLEIVQRLKDDLPGTLTQLLEEAAGDDRFSEQITSRAAAILAARNKQMKADSEPEPDVVMRYEDGTTEPQYSPAQLRKLVEWRERQIEKRLSEQFAPLRELQTKFTEHKQQVQMAQEAASIAEERGATWKSMPFFADHKDAILKRQTELYAEMQAAGGRFDPVNAPWNALQRAYSEVVSTQAVPKLQSQQTETLVAQAARKRAGSSGDPAASAPAQPRRPRTVDEALDQVFSGIGS